MPSLIQNEWTICNVLWPGILGEGSVPFFLLFAVKLVFKCFLNPKRMVLNVLAEIQPPPSGCQNQPEKPIVEWLDLLLVSFKRRKVENVGVIDRAHGRLSLALGLVPFAEHTGVAIVLYLLVVDLGVAGPALLQEGLDDTMYRSVMVVYLLSDLIDRHLVNRTHEDHVYAPRMRQDAVLVGSVPRSVDPVLGVALNLIFLESSLPLAVIHQVLFAEPHIDTRKLLFVNMFLHGHLVQRCS